jgi:FkbM family methyltransferase
MSSNEEVRMVGKILQDSPNPAIIELGGYQGEDTTWMHSLVRGRNPKMLVVEPDEDNFKTIVRAGLSQVSMVHAAIAAKTGTCDFWKCSTPDGRGSGSIRYPGGHLREKPWYDFKKLPEQIPCYVLDDLYRSHGFDHVDLLWVDIQGAEKDMIEGGKETLKHAKFMFIEAEERELYDGQALRPELFAMIPDWEVVRVFDFNVLLRNKAELA